MLSYCFKCRRNTKSINPKVSKTTNGKAIILSKFMPEIHLRQPQFTYSGCGPFTRHEERIQKFKETGDTNYVLDK